MSKQSPLLNLIGEHVYVYVISRNQSDDLCSPNVSPKTRMKYLGHNYPTTGTYNPPPPPTNKATLLGHVTSNPNVLKRLAFGVPTPCGFTSLSLRSKLLQFVQKNKRNMCTKKTSPNNLSSMHLSSYYPKCPCAIGKGIWWWWGGGGEG